MNTTEVKEVMETKYPQTKIASDLYILQNVIIPNLEERLQHTIDDLQHVIDNQYHILKLLAKLEEK